MIVPVGAQDGAQSLTVITRTKSSFTVREENDVKFVPFLSGKS